MLPATKREEIQNEVKGSFDNEGGYTVVPHREKKDKVKEREVSTVKRDIL
jgi:hypothetical protein